MATETLDRLAAFTDKSMFSYRENLRHPWYVNGVAFASDGIAAAWIPSEEFESPPFKGRRPNIDWILKDQPVGEVYLPLVIPDMTPCPDCKGLGYTIEEDCDECGGTGKVEHDCDCQHCVEEFEECEECDGEGKFSGDDAKIPCDCRFEPYEVQGVTFSLKYLHKIAALGDVVVTVHDNKLWFKSGDLSGTLMMIDQAKRRIKSEQPRL